jgi:hypothetical protein
MRPQKGYYMFPLGLKDCAGRAPWRFAASSISGLIRIRRYKGELLDA